MSASALYKGRVQHTRLKPRRHRLSYRVFSLLLDLDDLPVGLKLLGINRPGLLSFREKDHGDGADLRDWVRRQLAGAGIEADGRVLVLCYPRLLGYVFNPLTVYFCHDRDGKLVGIIHEVHNTHKERHTYVLPVDEVVDGMVRQHCAKTFYVSPFVPMECSYDFSILPPDERIVVAIHERDAEGPLLAASFTGVRETLSDRNILRAVLSHPLMTLKVTVGIHLEAVKLLLKGLRVYPHRPLSEK